MRSRRLGSVVPLGSLLAVLAWSQPLPEGPEFPVNTFVAGSQAYSAVAATAGGGFVVVWQDSGQDGDSWGVFGQRYDNAGESTGIEFQVNTYTTDAQIRPSVAGTAGGGAVVVWESFRQDGNAWGVFGQRYDSAGERLGAEFQVHEFTTDSQRNPAAAAAFGGGFVVVWEVYGGQDGDGAGLFGRSFDGLGEPLGSEFQVNSYLTGNQLNPAVTHLAGDGFLVLWGSTQSKRGAGEGLFGQRYDSAGVRLGGEFEVQAQAPQNHPAVAEAASGFVVVWDGPSQDGDSTGVFGQRYEGAGEALGMEFQVNSFTTSTQAYPAVARLAGDGFVIVWSSYAQDGSRRGVFGQTYASDGEPLGSEFQVNSHTASEQVRPSVAGTAGGGFVVTWDSRYQDGSLYGVFGQRFTFASPTPSPTLTPVDTATPGATPTETPSVQASATPSPMASATPTATGSPGLPVLGAIPSGPGVPLSTVLLAGLAVAVAFPAKRRSAS